MLKDLPLGKRRLKALVCLMLSSLYLSIASDIEFTTVDNFKPYEMSGELLELPPLISGKVYGDKIRRTMHLLSSSTKEKPNKVKIVFFGQSITRGNYSRQIIETKLRKEYPYAQLEVANVAIGGFHATRLVNTLPHILIPLQPDLIVFHVYGGDKDGTYEEIVKSIKKHTTAELIQITHHLNLYTNKSELEKQKQSDHRTSLASQYGSELVDIRKQWKAYLQKHDIDKKELLRDKIHHNVHGGELWGSLQARHFEVKPVDPQIWQDKITRIDLSEAKIGALGTVTLDSKWEKTPKGIVSQKEDSKITVEFTGTRLDVVNLNGLKNGVAKILVDGKKPSEYLGTWAVTLPSRTSIDYRPAIVQVNLEKIPFEEEWTLIADSIGPKGKEYSYRLFGSISGDVGKGDHTQSFTSTGGVLSLQSKHIYFHNAISIKKKPIPTPQEVYWRTYNTSLDIWESKPADDVNPSGQMTLVQGLENNKHTLEIIVESGTVNVDEILIYRPSL